MIGQDPLDGFGSREVLSVHVYLTSVVTGLVLSGSGEARPARRTGQATNSVPAPTPCQNFQQSTLTNCMQH